MQGHYGRLDAALNQTTDVDISNARASQGNTDILTGGQLTGLQNNTELSHQRGQLIQHDGAIPFNALDAYLRSTVILWRKTNPTLTTALSTWKALKPFIEDTEFNYHTARALHSVDKISYSTAQHTRIKDAIRWGFGQFQQRALFSYFSAAVPQPLSVIDPPLTGLLPDLLISHHISLVKLPERTVIEVSGGQMSLDIDAFSWTFSMTLAEKAGLDLVRPDASGVKEIELNFDGTIFVFIVEQCHHQNAFNQSGYAISGRSKTAYLTQPYLQPVSYIETQQRLASQLINNELINLGWTAHFNTLDWLVDADADAFSYANKTPMQAIIQVAGAVGAVIKPHNELNEFDINPRYKISPWDWPAATADGIYDNNIIRQLSGEWQPKPLINGVYVSGATFGVNCFVKRTGTAGDTLAQQVIDNLITTADAGRERGRNVICDRGNQELVSVELPVLPLGQLPDIHYPGDLLQVNESVNHQWKGLCIGVALSFKVSPKAVVTASQTMTLEKHHGNH